MIAQLDANLAHFAHIVERDLGVLAKWRRLVGARPAQYPAGVIEALGRVSVGRKVTLRLEHDKPWRGAVRAFAADVLVANREDVNGHFHFAVGTRQRVSAIRVAGAAVGKDDQRLRRSLAEPVRETFERGTQERVGIGRCRRR